MSQLNYYILSDAGNASSEISAALDETQAFNEIGVSSDISLGLEELKNASPDVIIVFPSSGFLSDKNGLNSLLSHLQINTNSVVLMLSRSGQHNTPMEFFGVVETMLLEEIDQAISVLKQKLRRMLVLKSNASNNELIFIRDKGAYIKLKLSDINYIQSIGNYVKIFTASNVYMHRCTMKKLIQNLPDRFIRIHKSYVVNFEKIDRINSEVDIAGNILPLGDSYRDDLLQRIKILGHSS
ncbi:MAG: LytR/AlgR family response regulator transcription factor [Luteibaculum sp.]